MVRLLFFQAVFVIWPFLLLKSLHPRQLQTLAALQMYFKQCHEPPWSEKTTWRSLMFGWNRSFAPFTIRFPGRYHCSLLKSFADWPNGTRLPCVISLCNSVCQAPRCSSIMMFSMSSLARATCRGALAISNTFNKNCDRMESSWDLCPMIWRIQKRRRRCQRRLLKSAPSVSLCICQTSSPFISSLGGLQFRSLLAPASRGSCFHVSFLKFCSKKRSSVPPFRLSTGVVSCVPSHCSENTTIAWHRGTGAPGVTFSARLWFQLRESPDDEAKENLLPEASIPKEV